MGLLIALFGLIGLLTLFVIAAFGVYFDLPSKFPLQRARFRRWKAKRLHRKTMIGHQHEQAWKDWRIGTLTAQELREVIDDNNRRRNIERMIKQIKC